MYEQSINFKIIILYKMDIYLKKNEERRLRIGHQWIFSNEIERTEGDIINGGIANAISSRGDYLGKGFYNKHSLIAYRHLTSFDEEINKDFLLKRIKTAEQMRVKNHPERHYFRLVNSESDFLPGLIIDKFGDNYSIQVFSFGMNNLMQIICDILVNDFKAQLIVEKNDNDLRLLEGLDKKEGILYPVSASDTEFTADIDGIKYVLNLLKGQKTGFYLDQTLNRLKIREYVSENSSVLDLFCNDGGFSLNAAYAGCKKITGVDSSEYCVESAKKNAGLNGFSDINFLCDDVFSFFDKAFQTKEKYNLIVLDPPSFTKSKKSVNTALRGYTELNYKALKLLHKNSILFTYSCSHHITEYLFEDMLVKAAAEAGRKIQIIEHSNCSYDHPVLPQMSETKYLKEYILRVL